MYKNREKIILASASPRRREFLNELGLTFTIEIANIEETILPGEQADKYVRRMAEEKALAVSSRHPEHWVISGDTIVCVDDVVLGKPESKEEAVETLLQLSGREHTVRSSFCVCHKKREQFVAEIVSTRVYFTNISRDLAISYVETGEPMDKAGAYGIQGMGAHLVKKVEGSYTNVVGLPLAELLAVLTRLGVVV